MTRLPARNAVTLAGRHLDETEGIGMRLRAQLDATDLSALRVLRQVAAAYVAGTLITSGQPTEGTALDELDELCTAHGYGWHVHASTADNCGWAASVVVLGTGDELITGGYCSGGNSAGSAVCCAAVRAIAGIKALHP